MLRHTSRSKYRKVATASFSTSAAGEGGGKQHVPSEPQRLSLPFLHPLSDPYVTKNVAPADRLKEDTP